MNKVELKHEDGRFYLRINNVTAELYPEQIESLRDSASFALIDFDELQHDLLASQQMDRDLHPID